MDNIEPNDVVQITNPAHQWFPSLVVVSELKSFGCQAFMFVPTNDREPTGQAYIRLNKMEYEKIGTLIMAPSDA